MAFLKQSRDDGTFWLISMAVLVLGGSYLGLYLLMDWADESFALAVPYRFYLGDAPFRNELNVAQLYSLFTYPFLHLYLWLQGTTAGLVLYTRHLYWVVHLGLFLWVRRCFMPDWGRTVATLVALSVFVFDPSSRRTLDYKSLYWIFFSAALVTAYAQRGRAAGWGPGVLLGGATFVNPGGGLACLLIAIGLSRLQRSGKFLGGWLIAVGVLGAVALVFLDGQSLEAIRLYHASRGSTWEMFWNRVWDVSIGTWARNPLKKVALVALLLGLGWLPRRLLATFLPLAGVFAWGVSGARSGLILYLAALGGGLLWLGGKERRGLALFLWIPAMVSGFCTGILTDGGLPNAAISLLPAVWVTLLLLALWTRRFGGGLHRSWMAPALCLGFLLVTGAEFRHGWVKSVFNSGPFYGIRERGWVKDSVEELERTLSAEPASGILFYGGWPSFGYLLSGHRPLAPTVYRCASGDRPCFDHFKERQMPGTLVVQWKGPKRPTPAFWRIRYADGDPLNTLLQRDYQVLKKTPHFWVWRLSPPNS